MSPPILKTLCRAYYCTDLEDTHQKSETDTDWKGPRIPNDVSSFFTLLPVWLKPGFWFRALVKLIGTRNLKFKWSNVFMWKVIIIVLVSATKGINQTATELMPIPKLYFSFVSQYQNWVWSFFLLIRYMQDTRSILLN